MPEPKPRPRESGQKRTVFRSDSRGIQVEHAAGLFKQYSNVLRKTSWQHVLQKLSASERESREVSSDPGSSPQLLLQSSLVVFVSSLITSHTDGESDVKLSLPFYSKSVIL